MMTNNPNADYDALLDAKKQSNFPEIYEKAMETIAKSFSLTDGTKDVLRRKRAFGLEKYGERAFQSNFENAMASPVAAHLGDEVIDALNYAMHGFYVANINVRDTEAARYSVVIGNLVDLIRSISELRLSLDDEPQKKALVWTATE